ncbi:hypothetical protein EDD18DRAFT_1105472 [Armillaria luteobubalina]|uniref:Uncharacterized protein n=1 Tax=Armillaria luteobubalina TaxID=153913 RepID=A0AA39Q4X9_9AGAR|nr:hypothetical protein EDD18DRAFT_1105472 [Armillaria luteobubalina]
MIRKWLGRLVAVAQNLGMGCDVTKIQTSGWLRWDEVPQDIEGVAEVGFMSLISLNAFASASPSTRLHHHESTQSGREAVDNLAGDGTRLSFWTISLVEREAVVDVGNTVDVPAKE